MLSAISLLAVVFKLNPDKLINKIIVGNAKMYKDIPLVDKSLVIKILFNNPNDLTIKPLTITKKVL